MGVDARIVFDIPDLSVVTDEWLKEKSWWLVSAIGSDSFCYWYNQDRLAIAWLEECDDETEETKRCDRLEVSLGGRYYGEGYERGDILRLCAIGEWLEQNLGATVYYGGDLDNQLEPFNEQRRQELRRHLYSESGRKYYQYNFRDHSVPHLLPPACKRCPGGIYRGSQYGCGGNGGFGAFNCPGCGKSTETRDAGKTWSEVKVTK